MLRPAAFGLLLACALLAAPARGFRAAPPLGGRGALALSRRAGGLRSASRLRAEGPRDAEEAAAPPVGGVEDALKGSAEELPKMRSRNRDLGDLERDIVALKRRDAEQVSGSRPSDDLRSAAAEKVDAAKGFLTKVLFADFVLVLGFLAWFLVGILQKYVGGGASPILDTFRASWDGLVQPALGVLMAGTIASGIASRE